VEGLEGAGASWGCSDTPAMRQQPFACSHPLVGKPACCKDSKPLRSLAATASAAMWHSVPSLWLIRRPAQLSVSHLWAQLGPAAQPHHEHMLVKQPKGSHE
jgi:hypothetical protein